MRKFSKLQIADVRGKNDSTFAEIHRDIVHGAVRGADFENGVFGEGFTSGGFCAADAWLRLKQFGRRVMADEIRSIFHSDDRVEKKPIREFPDCVSGARFTARLRLHLVRQL